MAAGFRRISAGVKILPEETMSTRSLAAAAAALLCFMLPARAQQPGADFPEGPGKQAVAKQWPGATPGSRPHDPRASTDGSIWYTGQLAGVLGRLDPDTAQIKEFPLKTPHTGPHGLAEDNDRNDRFSCNNIPTHR